MVLTLFEHHDRQTRFGQFGGHHATTSSRSDDHNIAFSGRSEELEARPDAPLRVSRAPLDETEGSRCTRSA